MLSFREEIPITKDLIYFDNASTSLMPKTVLDAMNEYELTARANVGRGIHRLSQISSQIFWDAHEKTKAFIGGEDGLCVFGKNCTEAINKVAYGMSLKKGDHVITTLLEHHSNILPWIELRNNGVLVDFITPDQDGYLKPEAFEALICKNTRLITFTHVSNVLGTVQPVETICSLAHDYEIKTLVDGAQSVPHIPVDVSETGCDYYSFSSHKMLGPMGIGVLWMKEPDLKPMIIGGGSKTKVSADGYALEEGYAGYEAGTPNVTGAIGLRAAIRILSDLKMDNVRGHETKLTDKLVDGLSGIDGIRVFGPTGNERRVGVVSFLINDLHPHDTAHHLDDQFDIMVRSGDHCCMPLMTHLGLPDGTVRASLYLYNTDEEVDIFLSAVRELSEGI